MLLKEEASLARAVSLPPPHPHLFTIAIVSSFALHLSRMRNAFSRNSCTKKTTQCLWK